MLHVAICDDEAAFVQHLSQLLDRYAQETGTELKISTFGDGADLTDPYDPTIDLIFLDIQMGIMDGLRTAQRIREMDGQVSIIFLTTLAQYSLEGYQYQATNYILKPLQYIRLKAEMDKFLARRQKEPDPFVVIANDAGRHRVALRDLRYIETFNRNLLCHTQEQNLISYRTMNGGRPGGQGLCPVPHQLPGEPVLCEGGPQAGAHPHHRGDPSHQPAQAENLPGPAHRLLGGYAVIITLLDVLSFVVEWAYALLFFWILHTFLPVRKPWPLRLAAVVVCAQLSVVVIYSNDLPGLLGAMVGFFGYVAVFHRGRWMKKVAAVLVFYPALIAVNYLMQDAGSNLFFAYTGAPGEPGPGWTESDWFWSTLIHTLSLLARLGFWVGAWAFLRRKLKRIAESLTAAMWWMVDAVMLAPFVCIFIIIYFMPEEMAIVYPVCFASIFSSFGCIYVAAYICDSLQDRYRAQALEKQQAYYKDRLRDEERVRSIYHDMKNHLLVLQAQTGGSQALHQAAQDLQVQLEAYESYQHTGNEYLDIVLRDKAKAAREKGIDFTAVTPFADGGFLAPLDISTLFGNALDNAIEACEKLPQGQRLVTVKTGRVRDMLLILVENTMDPQAPAHARTTKGDTFLHGYGLANLRRTAEGYGGHVLTRGEGGVFTLKILLPIPQVEAPARAQEPVS